MVDPIPCTSNLIVSTAARWSVYSTSTILILLYLYTLVRILREPKKSTLLIIIILMLIIVNISTSGWQYSNYLHYSEPCLTPDEFDLNRYTRGTIGMAIFGTLSTMFFEVSHWIFAYKYWIMSYRIQALMDGDSQPNLTC